MAESSFSRCRQVLDGLDIPNPFELTAFVDYIAARRSRRIALLPFTARHGLCGAWIQARHGDYIYYDEHTTGLHQIHIVVHELAHMLLGHEGTGSIALDLGQQLAPRLDSGLVTMMLGRGCAYACPEEREAETLASIVLERADRATLPTSPAAGPDHGQRATMGDARRLPFGSGHGTQTQPCSYRQLQPLWRALYGAIPHIALPYETGVEPCRFGFRLYRRVIEIRDGQLALRAYQNPDAVANAESQARQARLDENELNATVEAAAIATAISATAAGEEPSYSQPGRPSMVDPGRDLAHEIDWLARVSLAFARSPIVRPLRIAPAATRLPNQHLVRR